MVLENVTIGGTRSVHLKLDLGRKIFSEDGTPSFQEE